jgi:hypothetical protein
MGVVSGKIKTNNKEIKVRLSYILFKDGGQTVVYCPALDVYGYGADEEEAKESFKICMGEFFKYTLNKKTFEDVLSQLGWQKKSKKYTPPLFSSLLSKNKTLSEILNTRPFKKVDTSVPMPAFA